MQGEARANQMLTIETEDQKHGPPILRVCLILTIKDTTLATRYDLVFTFKFI